MKGYASIGTIYLLKHPKVSRRVLWAVVENNSNDRTSTLEVIEECEEKGMKAKIEAKWLYECEPVSAPILQTNGEIVIENGIEYVRPISKEKSLSKTF